MTTSDSLLHSLWQFLLGIWCGGLHPSEARRAVYSTCLDKLSSERVFSSSESQQLLNGIALVPMNCILTASFPIPSSHPMFVQSLYFCCCALTSKQLKQPSELTKKPRLLVRVGRCKVCNSYKRKLL